MLFLLILIFIPLTIGAIPLGFGISLISGRAFKKTETKKSFKTNLIIGIVLLLFGASIMNIPLAFDVINMAGTAYVIIDDQDRFDFYNRFVKTDTVVDATEDSAAESGFTLNGMHYSRVNGMKVKLHDPYRKDAAANLCNGKKTLFRYDNQSGCDLVCLRYFVYCPDEQMDTLDAFFRSGEMSYDCRGNRSYAKSIEADFPDDTFFGICDMDPSIVEKTQDDIHHSRFSDDPEMGFTVKQISGDKELERSFCVVRGADGEVYIHSISAFYGSDTGEAVYRVIDPSIKQFLLELNIKATAYY